MPRDTDWCFIINKQFLILKRLYLLFGNRNKALKDIVVKNYLLMSLFFLIPAVVVKCYNRQ